MPKINLEFPRTIKRTKALSRKVARRALFSAPSMPRGQYFYKAVVKSNYYMKIRNKELLWLSGHNKETLKYSGKWIAVFGNKIVASGKSAKDVFEAAKASGIKLPLITKVPRKDEEMYVLILL